MYRRYVHDASYEKVAIVQGGGGQMNSRQRFVVAIAARLGRLRSLM